MVNLSNYITMYTVGLAISQKQMLKAWEISGASALDANAKVTSDILTVDTLLEPIAPEEIGLVRCLGLNYRDHAVCFHKF